MKKRPLYLTPVVVTAIVLLLALSRLMPHPFNFSPLGAMALFGGARYSNRLAAYTIPLFAMWASDLILNYSYFGAFTLFYPGAIYTYGAFALVVFAESYIRKAAPLRLLGAGLAASLIFFLVSNFGVWASGLIYPKTVPGLTACYAAGLPFFRNTLAGDLIYTLTIFYGWEAIARYFSLPSAVAVRKSR